MTLHDTPKSLWMETAPAHAESPSLAGDMSCDVVVIGAGFTGLRAAHKLADAGTDVIVVDAGDVGFGASGRNGGQVNPILPFNGPTQLLKLLGNTYFERLAEVSMNSADSLFSFIEKYQIECQARQKGWLRVDHHKGAKDTSRKNAEEWIEHGSDMTFVEGDELFRLTGSNAYQSGVLTPRGGAVQPLSLALGIAKVARTAGAKIFGRSPATNLVQQVNGWKIQTPKGAIACQWVILATNGYTDGLLKGLRSSLLPLVSIQIATSQLPQDVIASMLPDGQTISDTRRIIMYARREPDNRLVFGGHGNIRRDGSLTGFDWLKKDAARIFPQLQDVEWEFSWGGKLAVTDDRLPHFHEPANGLIAGMGYNGRGVAMSNIMGTVLADRVLGAEPQSLAFPVSPIKRIPFREVQLLGKGTAIWWMQLLDRLETSKDK